VSKLNSRNISKTFSNLNIDNDNKSVCSILKVPIAEVENFFPDGKQGVLRKNNQDQYFFEVGSAYFLSKQVFTNHVKLEPCVLKVWRGRVSFSISNPESVAKPITKTLSVGEQYTFSRSKYEKSLKKSLTDVKIQGSDESNIVEISPL